jgi:hypothetical protein
MTTFEGEVEMDDAESVTFGTPYVADGVVIISDIGTDDVPATVADLKTLLGASSITNCSVGARRAYAADLDRIIG